MQAIMEHPDAWAAAVREGHPRAAARLMSALERDDQLASETLHLLHGDTGRAHIIGVTGSPGTGKSTLTDCLIDHYRRDGLAVGVIAVDPSSPFTGGAILGDRIRMQHRATDPGVFIRSMGTRGALGGLSAHAADAVQVLDAMGKDIILVETVGVGQAEVDIIRIADTVLLVLVPNLGDDVQAVKAGIMEIADLFIINKADLTGADRVQAEVEAMLGLAHGDQDAWSPPLLRTIAERGEGVEAVVATIARHKAWSQDQGVWHKRRMRRVRDHIRVLLQDELVRFAFDDAGLLRSRFADLLPAAQEGTVSPREAAAQIAAAYRDG